jgi:hypothetical protein
MNTNIDRMFLRVARVETLVGDESKSNATGFWYLHDNYLYLVTNRHVVLDEVNNLRPTHFRIAVHTSEDDLSETTDLVLPLYDDSEQPLWREHPVHGKNTDVVALPVNDPLVLASHFVDAFKPEDILYPDQILPMGQDVLIVGCPLGFHDTHHNLPIVRSATVASSFSHPFKGDPYFLTDGRMHRGTSGSPVIAKLMRESTIAGEQAPAWFLLGVHSAALDVSDRDPELDERLGLNMAWYAALITEIVTQAETGRIPPPPVVDQAEAATSPPTPEKPAAANETTPPAAEKAAAEKASADKPPTATARR